MKKTEYIPTPIEFTGTNLPPNLYELAEIIAENVHEVWFKNRRNQGLTYGTELNVIKKKTPCLRPYKEISNSEKLFDRETAFSTLLSITKFGYKIVKQ